MPVSDPLLQPLRLKHLTLRNRIISTSHEPAYSEQGMPKTRYRLYHEEKAKGGIALTMIGGSAVVSPDSPPAFGNLHVWDDAIVPYFREVADGVWLGRFPTEAILKKHSFRSVVDLTAEFSARPCAAVWQTLPCLDLVTVSAETLRNAAAIIERQKMQGSVLVCCALGYSRSAAAIACWLMTSGRINTAADAVAAIRNIRSEIVLNPIQIDNILDAASSSSKLDTVRWAGD